MDKDVVKEAIKEVLADEKQSNAMVAEARASNEPANFTVARASNGFIVNDGNYHTLNYIGSAAPKSDFPKIASTLDEAISIVTGAIQKKFGEAA